MIYLIRKEQPMQYYANEFYSLKEYMAHHGILGQKWGKQNGPPYPLGANDHSALEKKLNKYQEKAAKYKTKVPSHYLTDFGKHKAEKYTQKAMAMEGKASKLQKKLMKYMDRDSNNMIDTVGNMYKSLDLEAMNNVRDKMRKKIKALNIPVSDSNGQLTDFGKQRMYDDLSTIANSLNKVATTSHTGADLDKVSYELNEYLDSYNNTAFNNLKVDYKSSTVNGKEYLQTIVSCVDRNNDPIFIDSLYGKAVFVSDLSPNNQTRKKGNK